MTARVDQAQLVDFPEKTCLKQGSVGTTDEVETGTSDPVDMDQGP